jgi:hypothetical protein
MLDTLPLLALTATHNHGGHTPASDLLLKAG